MKLTKLQVRRFFRMLDPLTLYANARLDVVEPDELVDSASLGIDDQAQSEVIRELWQNLDVIDDFVRENPADLSAGELDTVASWRRGLAGNFLICRFPDGAVRFIRGEYLFDVSGISREIEDVVGELPAYVQTTLLPFDGRILYAEYLLEFPMKFEQNFLDIIEENARDLFNDGRIVSSADEFLVAADAIRDKQLEEDIEGLLADLDEMERESAGSGTGENASSSKRPSDSRQAASSQGGVQPSTQLPTLSVGPGGGAGNSFGDDGFPSADYGDEPSDEQYRQHRGALAGLSQEERARAISEHSEVIRSEMRNALAAQLVRACEPAPVVHSLSAFLSRETKAQLLEVARMFGVEGVSHARKAELVERLVQELPNAFNVEFMLSLLELPTLRSLRDFADNGGELHVPEGELKTLAGLPRPMKTLCYVFHEDDSFVFVMPDEMVDVVRDADWEYLIFKAERYEKLVRVGNALVELRGVVPIGDVGKETLRMYPELYDDLIDLVDDLLGSVSMGAANFRLVDDGEEMYLLHYALAWERDYDLGQDEPSVADLEESIIEDGPLGETVEGLLAAQQGKQARPLEPEMLQADDVFGWKFEQPAALALQRYFDANVPDSADDYWFADKVLEELLEEYKWGELEGSLERQFSILEQNGFVPEESQMSRLLSLLMNCANGLPIWPNNGWSPLELYEQETGQRIFLNEDGLPMKVGRNDPCPCGSGKKYKKCCGR